MKILFMRHPLAVIGGNTIFTVELIRGLRARGHKVGFWGAIGTELEKQIQHLGVSLFHYRAGALTGTWDVVVLQNYLVLAFGKRYWAQIGTLPHVFIGHSDSPADQAVPYPQLYFALFISENVRLMAKKWGLPDELTGVLYNPVSSLPSRRVSPSKKGIKILHLSRLTSDRIDVVRQLIIAVNRMPDCELRIAGSGDLASLVRGIANVNVTFLGDILDPSAEYSNCDVVVGSGRTVVEAALFSKPCIVLGRRGFVGLLTPVRFEEHRMGMFIGQNGNSTQRTVSPQRIAATLRHSLALPNLPEIVRLNRELAIRYYDSGQIAEAFERILERVVTLHKSVQSARRILRLRPLVASNCVLRRQVNGDFGIVREPIGRRVVTLSSTERTVLRLADGSKTIGEIVSALEPRACSPDVIRFVKEMWDLKVVVFDVPT